MGRLLDYPDEASSLGKQGREHIRRNFLIPELIRNYLILLSYYTGFTRDIPPFRLDKLSYSEIIHGIRFKRPFYMDPVSNVRTVQGIDKGQKPISSISTA